jgi:hypothetical protein
MGSDGVSPWWFVVLTVAVIPIVTAVMATVTALVTARTQRRTARYNADLQAAQKQRDNEIAHLVEFRNELMGTVGAAQRAVYYIKTSQRRPLDNIVKDAIDHLPSSVLDIYEKKERLRTLAGALIWPEIQVVYAIVREPFDDIPQQKTDAWAKAMVEDPNLFTMAINTLGVLHAKLLREYPVTVDEPPTGLHLVERLFKGLPWRRQGSAGL